MMRAVSAVADPRTRRVQSLTAEHAATVPLIGSRVQSQRERFMQKRFFASSIAMSLPLAAPGQTSIIVKNTDLELAQIPAAAAQI